MNLWVPYSKLRGRWLLVGNEFFCSFEIPLLNCPSVWCFPVTLIKKNLEFLSWIFFFLFFIYVIFWHFYRFPPIITFSQTLLSSSKSLSSLHATPKSMPVKYDVINTLYCEFKIIIPWHKINWGFFTLFLLFCVIQMYKSVQITETLMYLCSPAELF